MPRRKDGGPQHIEKSVLLRFHFAAKLPDWMMQPSRKLDRELMGSCRYQSARDLRRSWKCIGRNSAGPQFVTECCHVLVGVVPSDQPDGLLCSLRRRFQKNRQLTNNGSRCF